MNKLTIVALSALLATGLMASKCTYSPTVNQAEPAKKPDTATKPDTKSENAPAPATGTDGQKPTAAVLVGEFDNNCAWGLVNGKKVPTDCSINAQIDGKTYCFGDQKAKDEFMKDPKGNLAKAQKFWDENKAS
jgi:YHS domain-containing protein